MEKILCCMEREDKINEKKKWFFSIKIKTYCFEIEFAIHVKVEAQWAMMGRDWKIKWKIISLEIELLFNLNEIVDFFCSMIHCLKII